MEVGTKFVRKQLVHSLNCQETSSDSRRLRSRICSWLFHWTHLCWLVCELECLSLVVPNVARFAYQMSTCMSWVFLDQGGGSGQSKILAARTKIRTLGHKRRRSGQLCKPHGDDSGKQTTRTRVAPIFFWKKQLCLKRTTFYIGFFFFFLRPHIWCCAREMKQDNKKQTKKPWIYKRWYNKQAWKTR